MIAKFLMDWNITETETEIRWVVEEELLFGGIRAPPEMNLILPPFDHLSELVESDFVVAGCITGSEDPLGLGLVHVLHHLQEVKVAIVDRL